MNQVVGQRRECDPVEREPQYHAAVLRLRTQDEETLRLAAASVDSNRAGSAALVADKLRLARGYDVANMTQAVSILCWGRSGSLLLASYLDGHDQALVMPGTASGLSYKFFETYPALSLWEKLLTYPTYYEHYFAGQFGEWNQFFDGRMPIARADYYAAVEALHVLHGGAAPDWLAERRTFFQMLFVATAVATGRQAQHPRPIMVHSQHWFSGEAAAQFLADFPGALFLHTVRDPISAVDSWFDHQCAAVRFELANHHGRGPVYAQAALDTLQLLTREDRPQPGVEPRSLAVRFEDMHVAHAELMRRTAALLGIPFDDRLLASTFNGRPWVNISSGGSWTGANPANAVRRGRNLYGRDQLLLFALFYEDFRAWRYPAPAWLRHRGLRSGAFWLCWLSLWIWPMRMEWLTTAIASRLQVMLGVKSARYAYALRSLRALAGSRLHLLRLLAREGRRRLRGAPQQLEPL